MDEPGFFDVDERLAHLISLGDQLESFCRVVDFELFRSELDRSNYRRFVTPKAI